MNEDLTVYEAGLNENSTISVESTNDIMGAGIRKREERYDIEINIKFIKLPQQIINYNENPEIVGLLKLCLLKEISQKISKNNLKNLPELIKCIIQILSNGYVEDNPDNLKKNIIINFSNYVE